MFRLVLKSRICSFNPFCLEGTNHKITCWGSWTYFKMILSFFIFELNLQIFKTLFEQVSMPSRNIWHWDRNSIRTCFVHNSTQKASPEELQVRFVTTFCIDSEFNIKTRIYIFYQKKCMRLWIRSLSNISPKRPLRDYLMIPFIKYSKKENCCSAPHCLTQLGHVLRHTV